MSGVFTHLASKVLLASLRRLWADRLGGEGVSGGVKNLYSDRLWGSFAASIGFSYPVRKLSVRVVLRQVGAKA